MLYLHFLHKKCYLFQYMTDMSLQKQINCVLSSQNLQQERLSNRIIHYDLLTSEIFAVTPQQLNVQPLTKQHQCMQDYFDQLLKDQKKKDQIKNKLYRNFFRKNTKCQVLQNKIKDKNMPQIKYKSNVRSKTISLKAEPIKLSEANKQHLPFQRKSMNHYRNSSKLIDSLLSRSNFEINQNLKYKIKKNRTKSQVTNRQQIIIGSSRNKILKKYIQQEKNTPKIKIKIKMKDQFIDKESRLGEKRDKFEQFLLKEGKQTKSNKDKIYDAFTYIKQLKKVKNG